MIPKGYFSLCTIPNARIKVQQIYISGTTECSLNGDLRDKVLLVWQLLCFDKSLSLYFVADSRNLGNWIKRKWNKNGSAETLPRACVELSCIRATENITTNRQWLLHLWKRLTAPFIIGLCFHQCCKCCARRTLR